MLVLTAEGSEKCRLQGTVEETRQLLLKGAASEYQSQGEEAQQDFLNVFS